MVKDEKKIKEIISCELRKIEYNFSYIGTKYLIEVICIIITNKITEYDLQNDIYPILSKKYNTSVYNIKSDIRNATDKMYYDCEEKKLTEYMGHFLKPTVKKVINSILKRLRQNYEI